MPSPPVAYVAPHEKTSPRFAYAFSCGCKGPQVEDSELRPGPVALFGSPQLWSGILQEAIAESRTYYYGDHAYFGRMEYYRVTKNALQHSGHGSAGSDRFAAHGIPIRSWRSRGDHILVCPPDASFARLMGFPADHWVRHVVETLKEYTRRPIRVRIRRGAEFSSHTLAQDLEGAHALVTYTSNAAVEAVLVGVPVFCLGACAGRTMGLSDLSRIETPIYPDWREQWAANLAANQWTLPEIASGECWDALGGR